MLSSTSCVSYQHGSEYIRKMSLLGTSPNPLFVSVGISLLVQLFPFALTREAEEDTIRCSFRLYLNTKLSVGSRVDSQSDARKPLGSRHQIWHQVGHQCQSRTNTENPADAGLIIHSFTQTWQQKGGLEWHFSSHSALCERKKKENHTQPSIY